jgi:hypothetical protein
MESDSNTSIITGHLCGLGVAPELQALVAAATAQRNLTSHVVPGDYVAISPGGGGYIVGYFRPHLLSLAMPPWRAELVGADQGWQVEPDSGITSYVRIPAAALASELQRSVALALFLQSIDWRAAGPHQDSAASPPRMAPSPSVPTCPVHFTQMLGGRCDLCD